MDDVFANLVRSVTAPARSAAAITPSDSAALAAVPRAIYIGTGGTLVMRGIDGGGDQQWKNIPAGAILPFRASHVRATGTTAGDLLARY